MTVASLTEVHTVYTYIPVTAIRVVVSARIIRALNPGIGTIHDTGVGIGGQIIIIIIIFMTLIYYYYCRIINETKPMFSFPQTLNPDES